MKIIKRDGSEVPYDYTKIKTAIEAANAEVAEEDRLSETMVGFVVGSIERRIAAAGRSVGVEEIQDMVIDELDQAEEHRLARHYSDYRLRHELLRKQNSTDAKILSLLRHDNELAKQENANKDPVINSTMRDYLASEVSEDICRRYIFPEDVIRAHDEGVIHIHDMGYVSGPISNCELVNLEDMLQNGTVITDTLIEKPHSFSTACNIATQIIAQVASNTYGGQTISLAHLAPFVDVSRQKYQREIREEFDAVGRDYTETEVSRIAEMRVRKEVQRGIQTIQHLCLARRYRRAELPKGVQGRGLLSVRLLYLEEEQPGAGQEPVPVDSRALPLRVEAEGQAPLVQRPQADHRLGVRQAPLQQGPPDYEANHAHELPH